MFWVGFRRKNLTPFRAAVSFRGQNHSNSEWEIVPPKTRLQPYCKKVSYGLTKKKGSHGSDTRITICRSSEHQILKTFAVTQDVVQRGSARYRPPTQRKHVLNMARADLCSSKTATWATCLRIDRPHRSGILLTMNGSALGRAIVSWGRDRSDLSTRGVKNKSIRQPTHTTVRRGGIENRPHDGHKKQCHYSTTIYQVYICYI